MKPKTTVLKAGSCNIEDLESQKEQAQGLLDDLAALDPATIGNFVGIVIHRSEEDSPTHETRIYAMGAPDDILSALEKLNRQLLEQMIQHIK